MLDWVRHPTHFTHWHSHIPIPLSHLAVRSLNHTRPADERSADRPAEDVRAGADGVGGGGEEGVTGCDQVGGHVRARFAFVRPPRQSRCVEWEEKTGVCAAIRYFHKRLSFLKPTATMPLLSFLKPAAAPALVLQHDHGYVLAVLVATVLV